MTLLKEDKFKYAFITLFVFWFFNTAYKPDLSFIVGTIVSITIIYFLMDSTEKDSTTTNNDLFLKLQVLESRPDFLYTEPDLINFFYSILDFKVYNPDSFKRCIKTANNLLKIRKEMENDFFYLSGGELVSWQNFGKKSKITRKSNIKNLKEMFGIAEECASKTQNYLSSFSISLPKGVYSKRFPQAKLRYSMLIKKIMDDIYFHCKEFSTNPLTCQDYGLPKGYTKPTTSFNWSI